jgi:hypothetical protein
MKKFFPLLIALSIIVLSAVLLSLEVSSSKTDLSQLAERQAEVYQLATQYDNGEYDELSEELGSQYWVSHTGNDISLTEEGVLHYFGVDVDYWEKWLDNPPSGLPASITDDMKKYARFDDDFLNSSRYLDTIPILAVFDFLDKKVDLRDLYLNDASWAGDMDTDTQRKELKRLKDFRNEWLTDNEMEFFDELDSSITDNDEVLLAGYYSEQNDYFMIFQLDLEKTYDELVINYKANFAVAKTSKGIKLLYKTIYIN